MIEKLRVLPVLIIAATLLSGLKLGDAWHGISIAVAAEEAEAESAPDAEAPATTEPAPEAAADEAADAAATPSDRPDAPSVNFSQTEIEVLQSLAKRRALLNARAEEQEVRENVLKAAEKRVEEKIARLKQLEARVEALIKKRDAEGERQLRSLVKVYENMKPKDAARIFEQLEMSVLLEVAERMREQKIAHILADMNPMKAKELTVELATRQNLPMAGG